MRTISTICLLCLLFSCAEKEHSRIDFLVGTWKVADKEQYEVWDKNNTNDLIGHSYRIANDQKTITETLAINQIGNQIIYEATVPDQNEGATIPFTLNNDIDTYLSFENPEHDFPKKIQYKRINSNQIEVTVLGDQGKGFSYTQFRYDTNE